MLKSEKSAYVVKRQFHMTRFRILYEQCWYQIGIWDASVHHTICLRSKKKLLKYIGAQRDSLINAGLLQVDVFLDVFRIHCLEGLGWKSLLIKTKVSVVFLKDARCENTVPRLGICTYAPICWPHWPNVLYGETQPVNKGPTVWTSVNQWPILTVNEGGWGSDSMQQQPMGPSWRLRLALGPETESVCTLVLRWAWISLKYSIQLLFGFNTE